MVDEFAEEQKEFKKSDETDLFSMPELSLKDVLENDVKRIEIEIPSLKRKIIARYMDYITATTIPMGIPDKPDPDTMAKILCRCIVTEEFKNPENLKTLLSRIPVDEGRNIVEQLLDLIYITEDKKKQ